MYCSLLYAMVTFRSVSLPRQTQDSPIVHLIHSLITGSWKPPRGMSGPDLDLQDERV